MPFLGNAQTVLWADKVLEFSSELTSIQYSANQVLGKPDVLPGGGENPNAWTPDRADRKEFLKVGFERAIRIKQIAIAESYHPTAITTIKVYDSNGKEYMVGNLSPREIPVNGRMLNIFFETDFPVSAVKLELDGDMVSEYYSIDAIAISDSEIEIVAEVEIPENMSGPVAIDRLSENINSKYKEYKPVLSPDGKTLYFSRKYHPENMGGTDDPEDIWFSTQDESGEWQKAVNAGPELNNAGPNYVASVTPDGNSAIVLLGNRYNDNGKMTAGVSISTLDEGEWTKPINIDILDDYNYSDKANFYLANSRKALLMSVERDDSFGDRDLYVSFLNEDSTWTAPLNLGDIINTANVESAPFMAADDQTLYFSSNGFSGYGGQDIYVSTRLDDTWTNWSEPQNMGPQINSEFEDLFFNIPVNSEYAYYSRGVNDDDTDIFRIELPLFKTPEPTLLVTGKVLDTRTGLPVEAVITYTRLSDGMEIGIIKSGSETGNYEMILPTGELYGIHAEAEGYMAESQNIDLSEVDIEEGEQQRMDLKLVPIEVEEAIVLNNIFFDFDKATLRKESFPELDRIVELMNNNVGLEIEVAGHTDNSGPDVYNLALSRNRAQAVANYLIGKEIESNRINVTYFGESKPMVSNESREGRVKNRRVEFIIKKK